MKPNYPHLKPMDKILQKSLDAFKKIKAKQPDTQADFEGKVSQLRSLSYLIRFPLKERFDDAVASSPFPKAYADVIQAANKVAQAGVTAEVTPDLKIILTHPKKGNKTVDLHSQESLAKVLLDNQNEELVELVELFLADETIFLSVHLGLYGSEFEKTT